MERRCEACGKSYATKSARSRFCSSTCRSRAHRNGQGGPAAGGGLVVLPPAQPQGDGELVTYVEKTLTEAGRLESWRGQAALDMARRIERATAAPLSQAAAAHRDLRVAVAEAVKGANVAKSALQQRRDDLQARREKRRA